MASALCVLACVVALTSAAPLEEKFLPKFLGGDAAVDPLADVSSSDVSPIVTSPGALGKKIKVTVTKEFSANGLDPLGAAVTPLPPHAAHTHSPHQGHLHPAAAVPAQLSLNNVPFVIDNQTLAGVLQNLLAGNIENVQTHGQPLVLPPGGKPVAVIYSAAMHVVDLGNLLPAVGAPLPPAHVHPGHNHTAHPPINHTSLLESLISPLVSLTHGGAHAGVAAATPVAAANLAPSMQMQPVVVMMPVPQQAGVPAPTSADSVAQLGDVIEGILKAKQKLVETSAANHAAHAAAAAAVDAAAATAAAAAAADTGNRAVPDTAVASADAPADAPAVVPAVVPADAPADAPADSAGTRTVAASIDTAVSASVAAGLPADALPVIKKTITITKTKVV